jgi:hypothetical protein
MLTVTDLPHLSGKCGTELRNGTPCETLRGSIIRVLAARRRSSRRPGSAPLVQAELGFAPIGEPCL